MTDIMTDAILEKIKEMIRERFELDVEPASLTGETKIIREGLGFDSIAILDVIAGLEQAFQFQIEDEDLCPEDFGNLNTLAALVSRTLEKRNPQ